MRSLSGEQMHAFVAEMTPDDRARLLEELPAAVTRRLLESLSARGAEGDPRTAGISRRGTAGRYMTPEYVALRARR